jgi:hypothetical protein
MITPRAHARARSLVDPLAGPVNGALTGMTGQGVQRMVPLRRIFLWSLLPLGVYIVFSALCT